MFHPTVNNPSNLSAHMSVFYLVKWNETCPGVAGKGGFATLTFLSSEESNVLT